MKSRIRLIKLQDGKEFYNPSEEELKKLGANINSIIVEETLTMDEYKAWMKSMDISNPEWVTADQWLNNRKNGWYCRECDKWHDVPKNVNWHGEFDFKN